MTNGEKYKSVEERTKAFDEYCESKERFCINCKLTAFKRNCHFAWLELEAPLTASEVTNILEKYIKWRKDDRGQPSPCTWEDTNTAITRAIELLRGVKEQTDD